MYELTCYDIIVILTDCEHLLVYTAVIISVKFVTCQGPHAIYIAVHCSDTERRNNSEFQTVPFFSCINILTFHSVAHLPI